MPRKKKIKGLTPPAIIDEIREQVGGQKEKLQKVSKRESTGDDVLRGSSSGASDRDGGERLFAGSGVQDGIREGEVVSSSISKLPKLKSKRLQRAALDLLTETVIEGKTAQEIMLEAILEKAMAGEKWAAEFYRDVAHGKPGTVIQENLSEAEVQEKLDSADLSILNNFAKDLDG